MEIMTKRRGPGWARERRTPRKRRQWTDSRAWWAKYFPPDFAARKRLLEQQKHQAQVELAARVREIPREKLIFWAEVMQKY